MAKNKPNPMLAAFEAKLEARYMRKLRIANQMGLDAALIAANEVLGLGAGRAEKFMTAYIDAMNKMANMMVEDGETDPDLDWSTATIDKRLRAIVGDSFRPWDERYGRP